MEVQTYVPHPALQPFVRLFVCMDIHFPLKNYTQHITPKGEAAVFFPFGAPNEEMCTLIQGNNVLSDMSLGFNQPYLIGQSKTYGLFNWSGHVRLCVVALHPHALHLFLGDHASLLTNGFYGFDTLGKSRFFAGLQDRLWTVFDGQSAKQLVEQELIRFFIGKNLKSKPTNTQPIVQFINRQNGSVRVDNLVQKFRVGRRRLEQMFSDEVGLSPKEFIRVVRFREVMRHMHSPLQTSWQQIVADYNYTDQSHLIRDFKQFAGISPSALQLENPLFDQLIYRNVSFKGA
jgi:AraC-like DNA-binding protein